MEPIVVVLVLTSAVLHLVWNVLLKTSGDPLLTACLGMVAGTALAVPIGFAVAMAGQGLPSSDVMATVGLLALASGLVETIYFVLLSRAYRHGDLSVVYPTARGTAPLVAVALGVVVLGERLTPLGALGVAALLSGILLLQRPWRLVMAGSLDRSARIAASAALATGVAIAAYSAIDRIAVRSVAPATYAALLWPVMVVGTGGWIALARARARRRAGATAVPVGGVAAASRIQLGSPVSIGDPDPPAGPPFDVTRAVAGGLLTYVAYALVLIALSVSPLSAVAPLRESAVVLAAAWGAIRLREGTDRGDVTRRIGSAVLVVVGIALLVIAD